MDAAVDNSSREDARNAEDRIGGLGLSVGEMRFVARRQLIGSIAAASLIAVVATVAALRPTHHEPQVASAHNFAGVRQPVFVAPPDHRVAVANISAEVP